MWKRWAVISWVSFLLLVAGVVTWESYQCANAQKTCQSAASAHPLPNSMLPVTANNGNHHQDGSKPHEAKDCEDANGFLCAMLAPANLPNVYLVLAAIGGIVVAIGTLYSLDGQTEATKDSVAAIQRQADLQEAAMEQWVVVKDWRCSAYSNANKLDVRFVLWNPTKFPITIKDSTVAFKVPSVENKYLFAQNTRLIPDIPIEGRLDMDISQAEIDRFKSGDLIIGVEGFLLHTDMGPTKDTVLPVIGNLVCGRWGCRFDPQHIAPIKALHQDADKDVQ